MPMAGSMIVVDTNAGESALYEALVRRFDGSTVQRRKLDVGDVMLVAEAGTVYVERKTWLDLASSLIDRRYVEQKAQARQHVQRGSRSTNTRGRRPSGVTDVGQGSLQQSLGSLFCQILSLDRSLVCALISLFCVPY